MVNYSLALLALTVAVVRKKPKILGVAAGGVVLGAVLAAFYLVPTAYEEKWINLGAVLAPGVRPHDNFLFTSTQDADHNRFNLLVSIVGATEITLVVVAASLVRKRCALEPMPWRVLKVWAVAAMLLMGSFTFVFWEYLPKLRFVQFPWRWLLCLGVPLGLFFPVAFRRWRDRLLLCAALLSVLWVVGHRVQQPWWDSAADIEEMHDAISDGTGYEGTDEYVPTGVDPYELNKSAPQVGVVGRGKAYVRILDWRTQSKRFTAEVIRPEKLRLRLFNYPAWRVQVNGVDIVAKSHPVTGEIVVPLETGISEVRVTWIRTPDRLIGGSISLIVLLGVIAWMVYERRAKLGELHTGS